METPRVSNAVREHRISITDLHIIDVSMIAGDSPETFIVFAMEWESTDQQNGRVASGKIAIGPDTYSSKKEADERFDSIVENWSN